MSTDTVVLKELSRLTSGRQPREIGVKDGIPLPASRELCP